MYSLNIQLSSCDTQLRWVWASFPQVPFLSQERKDDVSEGLRYSFLSVFLRYLEDLSYMNNQ